jgi:hypothetical protein
MLMRWADRPLHHDGEWGPAEDLEAAENTSTTVLQLGAEEIAEEASPPARGGGGYAIRSTQPAGAWGRPFQGERIAEGGGPRADPDLRGEEEAGRPASRDVDRIRSS